MSDFFMTAEDAKILLERYEEGGIIRDDDVCLIDKMSAVGFMGRGITEAVLLEQGEKVPIETAYLTHRGREFCEDKVFWGRRDWIGRIRQHFVRLVDLLW